MLVVLKVSTDLLLGLATTAALGGGLGAALLVVLLGRHLRSTEASQQRSVHSAPPEAMECGELWLGSTPEQGQARGAATLVRDWTAPSLGQHVAQVPEASGAARSSGSVSAAEPGPKPAVCRQDHQAGRPPHRLRRPAVAMDAGLTLANAGDERAKQHGTPRSKLVTILQIPLLQIPLFSKFPPPPPPPPPPYDVGMCRRTPARLGPDDTSASREQKR